MRSEILRVISRVKRLETHISYYNSFCAFPSSLQIVEYVKIEMKNEMVLTKFYQYIGNHEMAKTKDKLILARSLIVTKEQL